MNELSLNNITLGKKFVIKEVKANGNIKRRLLDIGLTPGTLIELILTNPGGNLKAYMIRGALIAIRNDDTRNIIVKEYLHAV